MSCFFFLRISILSYAGYFYKCYLSKVIAAFKLWNWCSFVSIFMQYKNFWQNYKIFNDKWIPWYFFVIKVCISVCVSTLYFSSILFRQKLIMQTCCWSFCVFFCWIKISYCHVLQHCPNYLHLHLIGDLRTRLGEEFTSFNSIFKL